MSKGLGQKIAIKFDQALVGDVSGLTPTPAGGTPYFLEVPKLGLTYSASSVTYGPIANGFDGNTGTLWGAIVAAAWARVDFGAGNSQSLNKVRWYTTTSYAPRAYVIEGSNNATNWDTLASGESANTVGWKEHEFENTTAYRYYQFRTTTGWSTRCYVYEFEYYEKRPVGNEGAFTITGQEPSYTEIPSEVLGPLVDGDYEVASVEAYPPEQYHDDDFDQGATDGTEIVEGEVVLDSIGGSEEIELFDGYTNHWLSGCTFTSDGAARTTTKIAVSAGEVITVSGGNRRRVRWEDSSGNCIHSEDLGNSATSITVPSSPSGIVAMHLYYWYLSSGDFSLKVTRNTALTYVSEGIYSAIPIDALSLPSSFRIVWDEVVPDNTVLVVEYGFANSDVVPPISWTSVEKESIISNVGVEGDFLWLRVTFETNDAEVTPVLQSLKLMEPSTDPSKILLTMTGIGKFRNLEGDLTVKYGMTKGNLAGIGGAVLSFEETFTPDDLERMINPYLEEIVSIGTVISSELKEVAYIEGFAEEAVDIGALVTIEFIHIDSIDP